LLNRKGEVAAYGERGEEETALPAFKKVKISHENWPLICSPHIHILMHQLQQYHNFIINS